MNTLESSFPTLVFFLDSESLEASVHVCRSLFACARAFKSSISNPFAYLRLKGWRRKEQCLFFETILSIVWALGLPDLLRESSIRPSWFGSWRFTCLYDSFSAVTLLGQGWLLPFARWSNEIYPQSTWLDSSRGRIWSDGIPPSCLVPSPAGLEGISTWRFLFRPPSSERAQ